MLFIFNFPMLCKMNSSINSCWGIQKNCLMFVLLRMIYIILDDLERIYKFMLNNVNVKLSKIRVHPFQDE